MDDLDNILSNIDLEEEKQDAAIIQNLIYIKLKNKY